MGEQVTIQLGEQTAVDANALLNQHLLIIGATGAGKSTSAVRILHDLMMANQTTIVLDPTGEYATLPNAVVAQVGTNAFIDYERLTGAEWALLLGVTDTEMVEKLTDAVASLKMQRHVRHASGVYEKVNRAWANFEADRAKLYNFPQSFDVTLLAQQLQQEYAVPSLINPDFDLIGQEIDQQAFRVWVPYLRRLQAITGTPANQQLLNLPNRKETAYQGMRTDVMYLLTLFSAQKSSQKILVIDLSQLADDLALGQTIVSLLATALLRAKQQLTKSVPVVLMLDEAHRYLPAADGHADANGLSRIAREGRKDGLYLMLTTQSPLDVPVQMLGQFGTLLVHRLNTREEMAVLPALTDYTTLVPTLQTGEALLVGGQFNPAQQVAILVADEMQHRTASPKFF